MKKIIKTVGCSIGILNMAACSTLGMKDVEKKVNQNNEKANLFFDKSGELKKESLVKKMDGFWVNKNPIPEAAEPTAALPPIFRKQIVFNRAGQTLRLRDVLTQVERDYGLMFVIGQDAYDANVPAANNIVAGINADSTTKQQSSASGVTRASEIVVSDVVHEGTLVGLLDTLANKSGLYWKFDGERIHFFRYETRLFRIFAMEGESSLSSSVSSEGKTSNTAGTGGSGSNSSKNEATIKVSSNMWSDIVKSIETQLTPNRGKLTPMGSTGHIAVTDTPDQIRRIKSFVDELNKNLGKQVSFNVNIYSVELNDSDALGIDWGVVWQTMSSKYNVSVQTKNATTNLGSAFAVNFVDSLTGAKSNFNGSNILVGALSSIGKASLVTSTNLVTLNNIAVPLSVTNVSSYLKSQSVTVTGTSGTTQASLDPAERSLGLGLKLEPKLTETDDVFLRVAMNLSSDGGLRTYVSPDGKSSAEMPSTGKTDSYQTVKMKSGETLILSGFQQVKMEDKSQGIREASNWPLTGSRATTKKVSTLVVVITPYVMEN